MSREPELTTQGEHLSTSSLEEGFNLLDDAQEQEHLSPEMRAIHRTRLSHNTVELPPKYADLTMWAEMAYRTGLLNGNSFLSYALPDSYRIRRGGLSH